MTDHGNQQRDRLAWLDVLRGLAACVIAFGFHAQYLFAAEVFAGGKGGLLLGWMHRYGWSMVDLFFVLSGYVFAHVYLSGRSLERAGSLRGFALARFARLYPLHLLTLLLAALIHAGYEANSLSNFATQLLMLQVLADPVGHNFNGPTWSLSVEVLCYLLFALAARFGGMAVRIVSLAAVATGLAMLSEAGADGALTSANAIARGLAGFFIGQLLWQGRAALVRVPALVLAAGVVAGFALVTPRWSLLPLILLVWPCLLLLALRLRTAPPAALLWLGERSYTIYLLHLLMSLPVTYLAIVLSGNSLAIEGGKIAEGGLGAVLLVHGVLIAVVLGLSEVIYTRFERPARSWIRAYSARRGGRLASAKPA